MGRVEALDRYPANSYKVRRLGENYKKDVLFEFGTLITQSSDEHGRVLDLACGNGEAADDLEKVFGLDVVRVDLSMDGLRLGSGARVRALADQLPFPDGSFNGIHMKDALVHMPNKIELFRELARVLRPAGKVLIVSANPPIPSCFELKKQDDGGSQWVFFRSHKDYIKYVEMFSQDSIISAISPPYYSTDKWRTIKAAEKVGLRLAQKSKWVPRDQSDWYFESNGQIDRFVFLFEKNNS